MFTKQIGTVTVHFEPLIIFLVTIMIVYFLIALSLNIRGKKIRKSFDAGKYTTVLIDGDKLLKTYHFTSKKSFTVDLPVSTSVIATLSVHAMQGSEDA